MMEIEGGEYKKGKETKNDDIELLNRD